MTLPIRRSTWWKRGLWALGSTLAAGLVFLWLGLGRGPERWPERALDASGKGSWASSAGLSSEEEGRKEGGFLIGMGTDSVWFGQRAGEKPPSGSWGPRREALGNLASLGYLAGYIGPPAASGVLVYDSKQAAQGLNLCVSAHKASAELLSMEGKILHEWAYRYEDLPEALRREEHGYRAPSYFRYAHVFPNGDLLAIYDYRGLIKLNRFSHPLWYRPNGANHDLTVLSDGSIIVLGCQLRQEPRWNASRYIEEDLILFLDPNGEEQKRISLVECFENSPYAEICKERLREGGDIFHPNKVQLLDGAWEGKNPAFKKGNILVCLREINALAVVDVEKESIAWLSTGAWRMQHESQILPDGRLLLFDNQGLDGNSRILELDPFSGDVHWEYHASPPKSFRSFIAGAVQRLPNGGTLITDTVAGRAFELAPGDGRVVWEYLNTHRTLKSSLYVKDKEGQAQGSDQWLIAALFSVRRLPQDFPLDWIPRPGEEEKAQ